MCIIPVKKGEKGRGDVDLTLLRIQCFNSSSRKTVPMIIYNFTAPKRGVLWIIALNTRWVHSPQWLTNIVSVQFNRYIAQIWLRRTSSESIITAAGEISTHSDDGAQKTKRREILSSLTSLTNASGFYRENNTAQLRSAKWTALHMWMNKMKCNIPVILNTSLYLTTIKIRFDLTEQMFTCCFFTKVTIKYGICSKSTVITQLTVSLREQ